MDQLNHDIEDWNESLNNIIKKIDNVIDEQERLNESFDELDHSSWVKDWKQYSYIKNNQIIDETISSSSELINKNESIYSKSLKRKKTSNESISKRILENAVQTFSNDEQVSKPKGKNILKCLVKLSTQGFFHINESIHLLAYQLDFPMKTLADCVICNIPMSDPIDDDEYCKQFCELFVNSYIDQMENDAEYGFTDLYQELMNYFDNLIETIDEITSLRLQLYLINNSSNSVKLAEYVKLRLNLFIKTFMFREIENITSIHVDEVLVLILHKFSENQLSFEHFWQQIRLQIFTKNLFISDNEKKYSSNIEPKIFNSVSLFLETIIAYFIRIGLSMNSFTRNEILMTATDCIESTLVNIKIPKYTRACLISFAYLLAQYSCIDSTDLYKSWLENFICNSSNIEKLLIDVWSELLEHQTQFVIVIHHDLVKQNKQ